MVYLIGRFIEDPIYDEKLKLISIKVAVMRSYKNDEGVYETDIIPIRLHNQLAEHTADYCKKGDIAGIKGRLETDPNVLGTLFVTVDSITFLASKTEENN